jgi:hypothetical protein
MNDTEKALSFGALKFCPNCGTKIVWEYVPTTGNFIGSCENREEFIFIME